MPASPSLLRRFAMSASGNVAVIFGLLTMPIMIVAGVAVDYGRMGQMQTLMQSTTDLVALAAAKEKEAGKTDDAIKSKVTALFAAEMKIHALADYTVDYSYDTTKAVVTVSAEGKLKSSLLGVLSIDELTVGSTSSTTFGTDHVEIALVLDTTGSMNQSSKLSSLKSAANSMIDSLAATEAGRTGKIKVAVVPFGVYVNVGTTYDGASWLGPRRTQTTTQCYWSGWTRYCYSTTTELAWYGCINDRSSPYTTTITSPTTSNASTLYPRSTSNCGTSTILPLTADFATAKSKITNLSAGGNTNIPIGAVWGWNMLTTGAPASSAAASTTTKKILKYMILLTDGENTQDTLGSSVTTIDGNTSTVCTNVKNASITLFTIRVIDGDETLLRNCATSADHYFDVSNPAALTSVFQKIVLNITKLRLSS